MKMNESKIKRVGKDVIKLESIALAKLSRSIGKDFAQAVELISQNNGKVIISGIGKSGNIAGKIAAGGHDATATLKLLSIPGAALNLTMDDLGRKVGVDMDFADKPDEDAEVSTDAPVQTDAPYSKDDFSKIIASRAGSGFLVPFNLDEGPGGANITNVEDLIESGQLTRDDANRLLGRQ